MISLIKSCQIWFDTDIVYVAGGSLAPHKTNDIDIVILNDWTQSEVFQELEYLYKSKRAFDSLLIYKAYGQGPEEDGQDPEEDGKFHTKAVCKINDQKVDLLFAFDCEYPTIESVMDGFPLSIQMQAMDCKGKLIRGAKYLESPIIVYREECIESCIKKYKGYYPNHQFINTKGEEV